MDWRQPSFPAHDGEGWAIWRGGKITPADQADATKIAARWLPPSAVLVGQPGAARFEPPIKIPALQAPALEAIARHTTNIVLGVLGLAITLSVLAIAVIDITLATWAALLTAFAVLIFADYRVHLHSSTGVLDRALFFHALRTRPAARVSLAVWTALGCAMGILQFAAQVRFGNMDAAFHRYGAMYPAIRAGETWRIVTGPLLHYSLDHFLVNFALLVFGGWLATSLRGAISFPVFVAGCAASAAAQFRFGGNAYESFGGISGGVFALLAFTVAAGVVNRELLPRGMGTMLSGLLLLSVLSAELLSANSATTAHVAGIAVGVTFGAVDGRFTRSA